MTASHEVKSPMKRGGLEGCGCLCNSCCMYTPPQMPQQGCHVQ
jgi:hypothetical protein